MLRIVEAFGSFAAEMTKLAFVGAITSLPQRAMGRYGPVRGIAFLLLAAVLLCGTCCFFTVILLSFIS